MIKEEIELHSLEEFDKILEDHKFSKYATDEHIESFKKDIKKELNRYKNFLFKEGVQTFLRHGDTLVKSSVINTNNILLTIYHILGYESGKIDIKTGKIILDDTYSFSLGVLHNQYNYLRLFTFKDVFNKKENKGIIVWTDTYN